MNTECCAWCIDIVFDARAWTFPRRIVEMPPTSHPQQSSVTPRYIVHVENDTVPGKPSLDYCCCSSSNANTHLMNVHETGEMRRTLAGAAIGRSKWVPAKLCLQYLKTGACKDRIIVGAGAPTAAGASVARRYRVSKPWVHVSWPPHD